MISVFDLILRKCIKNKLEIGVKNQMCESSISICGYAKCSVKKPGWHFPSDDCLWVPFSSLPKAHVLLLMCPLYIYT